MNNNQSFFSVDRLVEFGLGLNIAQQMVSSMNNTINSMQLPGENRLSDSLNLFVAIDEKPAGPFSEKELLSLISNNQITKDSLVWKSGMTSWKKVIDVPEVLRIVALTPPPIPKEDAK